MNGIFSNYLWTMFWEAYFESCDFSRENTNIDVSVFMFDLRMLSMLSGCEYDWYWKISACSTEYEVCDLFVSLTRHQTSYSGSAGWYFRYQSIHIQITYTYFCIWLSNLLILSVPEDGYSRSASYTLYLRFNNQRINIVNANYFAKKIIMSTFYKKIIYCAKHYPKIVSISVTQYARIHVNMIRLSYCADVQLVYI